MALGTQSTLNCGVNTQKKKKQDTKHNNINNIAA